MLKKIFRKIGKFLLGFLEFGIAFGFLYGLFVVICSIIPVGGKEVESGFDFYVRTNGVHTDICLPVETDFIDWKEFIPSIDYPDNTKFKFIAIGWGDKGFFLDTPTWDDLTMKTAINAALLPSTTAMHVQYLDTTPILGDDCKQVIMEWSKYPDLIDYIKKSFQLKNSKVDLIPNSGYWANDNFYEANGKYHMFRTCNIWTNNALKVAGVSTALYGLLSDGIMRHL